MIVKDLVWFVGVTAAMAGIGDYAVRRAGLQVVGVSVRLLLALGLGIGAVIFVTLVAGMIGGLHRNVVLALLAVGWTILVVRAIGFVKGRGFTDCCSTLVNASKANLSDIWALEGGKAVRMLMVSSLCLLCVLGALNLFVALLPAFEGDTLARYLNLPRYWVEEGRYFHPSHVAMASLPGNMLLFSAVGLALDGIGLAQAMTGYLMGVTCSIAVYVFARMAMPQGWALVAAVVFYMIPDVRYLSQSAKVDLGWAAFELILIYAVLRWWNSQQDEADRFKWLAIAGCFSGLAVGSKYHGMFNLALLAGSVAIVEAGRSGWLRGFGFTIGVVGIAFLFAGPYYVINSFLHHNPFHPAFSNVFAAFGAELTSLTIAPRNPGHGISGLVGNVWDMSLRPDFAKARGAGAGPVFLAVIPAGLLLRRTEKWERLALGYTLIYYGFWYLGRQRTRHFLPALAVLSILTAYHLYMMRDQSRWVQMSTYGVVAIAFSLSTAFGVRMAIVMKVPHAVAGIISSREYRDHALDTFTAFPNSAMTTYINSHLTRSNRIVGVMNHSGLYLKPDYMRHTWIDGVSVDGLGVLDIVKTFQDHNISHVLINEDVVDMYREGYGWEEFEEPTLLDSGLRGRWLDSVFSSGRQTLYGVRSSPREEMPAPERRGASN